MKISYCIGLFFVFSMSASAQTERLIYHNIKSDGAGNIVPWCNDEPGKAWSQVIQLVCNFWDTMIIGEPLRIEDIAAFKKLFAE